MTTVPRAAVARPATVVVAAVLAFLDAALLLVGLVSLLLALLRLSVGRPGSLEPSTLAGVLGAAVLIPVVLATVEVISAVLVLLGRPVGRVLLSVVAALLVAQAVIGLVAAAGRAAGPSALVPVGLVLSLAVLVLLWLPASRPWFVRR